MLKLLTCVAKTLLSSFSVKKQNKCSALVFAKMNLYLMIKLVHGEIYKLG